jgi:hypothetical protein
MGRLSGDGLGGMVDIAQHQLVPVPHQHQRVDQFSVDDRIDSF